MTPPARTAASTGPASTGPASTGRPGGDPGTEELDDGELAARAWQAMRALVLDRYDRRKQVCESLGMSFIRAKALRRIAGHPMTMRELAAGLGTDPGYTTVVVDDLERRGLVTRTVSAGDRRSKIVSITPAGAAQATRAGQILSDPPGPVRDLSPDDLASLTRILSTLLNAEA